MKPRYSILIGVGMILFATLLVTSTARAAKTAQSFIREATIGNQFEISSSRLALQNSQNEGIKQFAQQMVDDHTQVGNQLKSVVSASDADLKMPASNLDSEHQAIMDRLNKLSGLDFDKQYVEEQVKAHDGAVALFQKYSAKGDNEALKAFATQALPTLQEHRKNAHELKASL